MMIGGILSSLVLVAASNDVDASSLLQLQHTDGARIMDAMRKAGDEVCLSVARGKRAPIAGVFKSDGKVVDVRVGDVAPKAGVFCVPQETLALIQRSFGLDTASLMDQAISKKGPQPTCQEQVDGLGPGLMQIKAHQLPDLGNLGNIDIPDMTTPDLNGMTTPDLNGMTTPDLNGMTTPDLNGMTTPDLNGMTTPDLNNGGNSDITTPDLNNGGIPDLNNLALSKAVFCTQVQMLETNTAMLDLLINGYKGMGKLSSCDRESSKAACSATTTAAPGATTTAPVEESTRGK